MALNWTGAPTIEKNILLLPPEWMHIWKIMKMSLSQTSFRRWLKPCQNCAIISSCRRRQGSNLVRYPEVRKEVVSFIYQIWNIYRFQSAGRGGPGRTNCGWKNRKVALRMDVNDSIWWGLPAAAAYIFILDYITRLSGRPLNIPLFCQLDRQWEWTPHLYKKVRCLHVHTCGYPNNFRCSGWASLTGVLCLFALQTYSPTSRVHSVRESWLVNTSFRQERETTIMNHLISTWEPLHSYDGSQILGGGLVPSEREKLITWLWCT